MTESIPRGRWGLASAFVAGALIGCLGGLIGLGGAEFRLPLLIGLFGFVALEAVILNKAASLIVVIAGLVFRAYTIPWPAIGAKWLVIINLLAGSLLGAWFGASWAVKLASRTLYRVIAALLLVIAAVLWSGHSLGDSQALLTGFPQVAAGMLVGGCIGFVASLLGVAGGELLIPTLILLFGIEVKLAGSLSFVVSLPTMLVGFARYSKDQSFRVLRDNRAFVVSMAAGSICGAMMGALLLGYIRSSFLIPLLVAILLVSAIEVWRHS